MYQEFTERLVRCMEYYGRVVGITIISALLEILSEAFKILLIIVSVYGLGHLLLSYFERNFPSITWPLGSLLKCCPSSDLKVHIRQLRGSLTELEADPRTSSVVTMLESEKPETTATGSEHTLRESQSTASTDTIESTRDARTRNRRISCNLDDDSLFDIATNSKLSYRRIRFEPS